MLYEKLYQLQPGPIIAMNMAIASGYVYNKSHALQRLLAIKGLENYYLYHTSIGEMYFDMNEKSKARKSYEIAMQLTNSQQEKQLLKNKISNCGDV